MPMAAWTDRLRRPAHRGRGPGDCDASPPNGRPVPSFEGPHLQAERPACRQATALPGAPLPDRPSGCGRPGPPGARTPSSAPRPSPSESRRIPGSGARQAGGGRGDPRRGSWTATTCRTRNPCRTGSPHAPCPQRRRARHEGRQVQKSRRHLLSPTRARRSGSATSETEVKRFSSALACDCCFRRESSTRKLRRRRSPPAAQLSRVPDRLSPIPRAWARPQKAPGRRRACLRRSSSSAHTHR